MNYEKIDELTPQEILQFYDDIIIENDEILITNTWPLFYVECTNGKSGFAPSYQQYNPRIGYVWYGNGNDTVTTSKVCGYGRYGTSTITEFFDDSTTASGPPLYYIECDNGIKGFYPKYIESYPVGFTYYGGCGEAMNAVCGYCQIGKATVTGRIIQ